MTSSRVWMHCITCVLNMSERIGSTQNQNVDVGSEDMALLSDNLTRLQGEVSAFRKQLADSHQDWGQIKSRLFGENGRYDESICTDKGGNPQTAVTSGTVPAGTQQAQKPEGNSPPHFYLPCILVDAVSGQRSGSDTFSFGPQCLAVQT